MSPFSLKTKYGISEMLLPEKSTAENKLANSYKKYNQAIKKEYQRRKNAKHLAKPQATRLAKATFGSEAAEDIAAANWAAKSK